ncbi:hypothetical protein PanWU01x14_170110 [Parasponia andersonii]|uniref:Uncharacterized protein n=1 Tax=Parasponia andersonii TaxID=3476 RepID=A0A2P5CA71_PARAD|nr:hypothetical protein PanWU01x14_170110 [Parasponia andersonii]
MGHSVLRPRTDKGMGLKSSAAEGEAQIKAHLETSFRLVVLL